MDFPAVSLATKETGCGPVAALGPGYVDCSDPAVTGNVPETVTPAA